MDKKSELPRGTITVSFSLFFSKKLNTNNFQTFVELLKIFLIFRMLGKN
jgi:hypothetical protein